MSYRALVAAIVGGAVAAGAVACGSCTPTTGGHPTTPGGGVVAVLIDGGCLAPGDDAAAYEVLETLASDAAPSWLVCLAEGGTVSGCGVPCK